MPSPTRSLGLLFASLLLILLIVLIRKTEPEVYRSQLPPDALHENRPPVSYTFELRPILARKCFGCHGGDEKRNKSGLRLDRPELAFHPLGEEEDAHRHAWVPGDRNSSEVWKRISSRNEEELMPPLDSGHRLDEHEKRLLGRWIEEGAHYEPHWAFQPVPPDIPVPEHAPSSWPKSDLDRFVFARLEHANREPADQAEPEVLLRRFALALTGLPPTLEEFEEFRRAANSTESARGAATIDTLLSASADRLLASPAFGQHFAGLWLETAGYADTISSSDETLTNRWVYRDWVVEACNKNLPYDEFLTAQLAGDLQGGEPVQTIATAFNRLHPLKSGEDVDAATARAENQVARAANLGSTVLGLSLACARCHDHKLDDLPQRDVHALARFFALEAENGLSQPGITPAPTLAQPSLEQLGQLRELQAQADEAEGRAKAMSAEDKSRFSDWLAEPLKTAVINDAAGIYTFDERKKTVPNHALTGSGSADATGLEFTDGLSRGAVSFDGTKGVTLPNLLAIHRWTPWSFTLRFRTDQLPDEPVVLLSRGRGAVDQLRGLDLLLEGGHLVARLSREWPGNAVGLRTTAPLVVPGYWHLLTWTYDGSSSAEGMRLYLDGKAAVTEIVADSLWKLCFQAEDKDLPLLLGWRPDARGFAQGAIDDFQVHTRALTPLEVATLYDGSALPTALAGAEEHRAALQDYYFSSIYPLTRSLQPLLAEARGISILPEEGVMEVAVMKDSPTSPAGIPAFLQPGGSSPPLETPHSRISLAQAVVRHPLTARVFVNRLWTHFFGHGLVSTTNDFGLSGEVPSHPGLLDWLARDFIAHGWDVKRLCRQIVLSATYRQESGDPLSDQPELRLLAQGPSFPLSPDHTRDFLLHAAGMLDDKEGGPPVGKDSQQHRRSLYDIKRHTLPRPTRSQAGPNPEDQCAIDYRAPAPTRAQRSLTEEELQQAIRRLAAQLLRTSASDNDSARCRALALLLHGTILTEEETAGWLEKLESHRNASTPGPTRISDEAPPDALDPAELTLWSSFIEEDLAASPPVQR